MIRPLMALRLSALIACAVLVATSSALADGAVTQPATPATTQASPPSAIHVMDIYRSALKQASDEYWSKVHDAADRKTELIDYASIKLTSDLDEVQTKETQDNQLQAAVEVRELIRAIQTQKKDWPKTEHSKAAQQLRKVYDQLVATATATERKTVEAAYTGYRKQLDAERTATTAILRQLAKDAAARGDLDEVLEANERLKQVDAEVQTVLALPDPRKGPSPTTAPADPNLPVDLLSKMTGTATRRDAEMVVLKNSDAIASTEKFKPPVAFNIVAKLDSNNLRLGYIASKIIFNWEMNNADLRVDGGPADGRHMPGAGKLPVSEWVNLDLIVEPNCMTIWVNGKPRYITYADFSNSLDVLKIYTYDATVRIKSVTVRKP
jgi:hypothetical protein